MSGHNTDLFQAVRDARELYMMRVGHTCIGQLRASMSRYACPKYFIDTTLFNQKLSSKLSPD